MLGFQRLAFRDVGHFYPPLYAFIGEADSFFPLWNPFDHTGVPIGGETTTAIFYPPRLVFSLGLPGSVAMGWYVAMHLALAIAATTWVARTIGCRREASLIAGVVYAFSGPVIFLYCNPPFLVGAAWMPLALGGALQLAEAWSAAKLLITAVGLAMCTLGGDPQTTVHVGMIVGGTLLWRQLLALRKHLARGVPVLSDSAAQATEKRARAGNVNAVRRPLWLPVMLAAMLAGLLAAPQIAAALDWSRHSARRYEPPPGISQLLADSGQEPEQRWWQAPPSDTHAADIYQFSIAPWHWLDLFIPKLSGELFPEYQRLSALLPAERRVWTITLYAGFLPLLSVLARYFHWRRRSDWYRADVWDALIPLGVLLSLGAFGPIWFLNMLLQSVGITTLESLHEALFSPYWIAVTTIPGYGAFRYPAKWLPFVILGCSIATARGLSQLDEANSARMQRAAKWVIGIGVLSAIAAAAFLLWPNQIRTFAAQVSPDAFWGPLAVESAIRSVFVSSLHIVFFAACAIYLLRRSSGWKSSYRVAALGGLLCLDLLVVGYSQVATIDRRTEQELLAGLEAGDEVLQPFNRLIRTRVGRGWPSAWASGSHPNRLLEVETSSRHAMFGRWHLERSLGMLNSATSIVPQRTQTLWRAAQKHADDLPADERTAFWLAIGRVLSVDGFVARSEQGIERPVANGDRLLLVDRRTREIAGSLPKVRWHDQWETIPPLNDVSERAWEESLARWYRDGDRYLPLVESDDPSDVHAPAAEDDANSQVLAHAAIRLRDSAPSEMMIDVMAARRGLLLLSQYQDGNWQANVRQDQMGWKRVDIHQVDYLGQGIILPAGDWEVRVHYQPPWLIPSLLVSGLGVLLLAGSCTIVRRRK